VQGVANPKAEQAANDFEIVSGAVLVNTLIVGWVNWVVSVTIAGNLGSFALLSGRFSFKCSQHIDLQRNKKIVTNLIILT